MCNEYDFMKVQVHKINVDKWCQGVVINSDPGDVYVTDWVCNNAQKFRDDWNNSVCQNCSNLNNCGYLTLSACDHYNDTIAY